MMKLLDLNIFENVSLETYEREGILYQSRILDEITDVCIHTIIFKTDSKLSIDRTAHTNGVSITPHTTTKLCT